MEAIADLAIIATRRSHSRHRPDQQNNAAFRWKISTDDEWGAIMSPDYVKQLTVGCEIATTSFRGKVTCVDLIDDDKIVIKWDCAESEDVLSETSPLWLRVEAL
jgi:hypothetical protein